MANNISLFLFIIINSLFSCKTVQKNTVTNTSLNNNWVLTHLNKNAVTLIDSTQIISLQIETLSNKFSGFGGCNRYNGNLSFDKNENITFSKIISTKKYCPPPNIESQYFSILSKSTSYILSENELTLFESNNEIARFKKK
jgi:heat shock protein HslJ